jgi:phosphoribosylaminoimidazole-succinocarboxamide synthase
MGVPSGDGAVITAVNDGSPAKKAGVAEDDAVTAIDGERVPSADAFRRVVALKRPDSQVTLALYRAGAEIAERAGLILADTKFEFGWIDGELALIDEVFTPDSSRFWDAALYAPGSSPPSFDKQYVRDFVAGSGWDKEPPAPPLPDEVIAGTRDRYVTAYERLTGLRWGNGEPSV